jgi:hypothetical protein
VRFLNGGIAQLVERLVRNEKARGSNPLTSTTLTLRGLQRSAGESNIPCALVCVRPPVSMGWVFGPPRGAVIVAQFSVSPRPADGGEGEAASSSYSIVDAFAPPRLFPPTAPLLTLP